MAGDNKETRGTTMTADAYLFCGSLIQTIMRQVSDPDRLGVSRRISAAVEIAGRVFWVVPRPPEVEGLVFTGGLPWYPVEVEGFGCAPPMRRWRAWCSMPPP